MRKSPREALDRTHVRDRRGRSWTVTVTALDEDDDLAPWIDMTPQERLDLVGECVLDGLRLRGKLDVPRLRRVLRVTQRAPRAASTLAAGRPQDLVDADVLRRALARRSTKRPRS